MCTDRNGNEIGLGDIVKFAVDNTNEIEGVVEELGTDNMIRVSDMVSTDEYDVAGEETEIVE